MTGSVALLVVASVVIVAIIVRARVSVRARDAVAARLTTGSAGVIAGASPIDLDADGRHALLLLHGFGDTPQTLEYLATYLHAQGWAVRAPLLPGHGRTLDAFSASRGAQWIAFAHEELARLRSRYPAVAIVGLSMGGSLATILASEVPDVRALVLLAPYLSMPTRLRRAANFHYVLGALFPYLRGGGEHSIRDPTEVARNLAYGFTTPRLVYELGRVVDLAREAAPRVSAPTLVVQSRQDNRIPPDAAERAFNLFTTRERRLLWTEGNGHIITVDYGRQTVFAAVADWLEAHARDPQAFSNA
ncbi:MAG: alpha/beta hydrolase, partial [Gemmatimonadaceae bacterium]